MSYFILSGVRDGDRCRLIFFIKSKADKSKMLSRVMVNEQAEVWQCTNNNTWARDKGMNQELET